MRAFLVREDGNDPPRCSRAGPATDPMQVDILVDTSAAARQIIGDIRRAVEGFGDRRLAPDPQHQVAFPMTRHRTVFDLSRSIRDEDHLFDVAPWVFAPMRATTGTP